MSTSVYGRLRPPRCVALLAGLALLTAAGAAPARASFAPAPDSPLAVGAQPYTALAQDFDGDGRVDVASMNGTASNLSVFLRTPAGAFAAAGGSPFATGSGPSKAVVADFNADGRSDFAVSNYVSGTVSVLLAQPLGGWALEGGSPGAQGAAAVAAADVNGDNRPDLLVPDYNAGGVTVLLRQPGGGFVAEAGKPATGANPRDLAVADFNADGRPDTAVTNLGSGTVTVLLRQPGGGFAAESGSPIPVGTQPNGIVARDLNGDGRPDLAVANYGSDSVTVLLRQPGGGFAPDPASPVAVGDGPIGIVAPDVNGDGIPDLAVANNAAGTVSVLLRRAAGSYDPDAGSPIGLPANPSGVASGDVDADGRPDLVVTSDQANVLNVLLNTTPRPAPAAAAAGPGVTPAPLRLPVAGVAAKELELAGSGGKVSQALERALAKADLEAILRAVPTTSQILEQVSKQKQKPAVPDPAVQQRLDSFVYGVPVEVSGSAGEVVDIAAAFAIASRGGAGGKVTVVELPPVAAELQGKSTTVRLPVDAKAAAELQRNGIDEAALAVTATETTADKLDALGDMTMEKQQRLQIYMDVYNQTATMISNILQKVGETSSAIVGNLKRPGGNGAASKAALRRRAGVAANKANAAAHKAAALLAPVLRAHPIRSPRATFALRPCPKRCAYPRFGR